MNEDKQNNPDIKQVPDGTDKKTHRDVLKWIIIAISAFVIIILIFGGGMLVGGMKAKFSYRWAESYHKNFAGPMGGFLGDWRQLPSPPGDFIESHGTFGEIIQINDSDFVIKGQSDLEKIIVIKENTILEKGRMAIKKDDLRVGDQVVIIGSPNEQGQIEARLIRVFNGEDVKDLGGRARFPLFR